MQYRLIYNSMFLWLVMLAITSYARNPSGEYHIRKVVIDAGHGGGAPGVIGKKLKEKDVVLSIALKVGKLIKAKHPNVEIIYTRDRDIFVGLKERSDIANKAGADLFISIHANSVENRANTSVSGSEVYIMGLHKTASNMEVAQRENAVVLYEQDYESKYEGFDPNSPESYIIFSLMQSSYFNQSLTLATMMQEQLKLSPIKKSRGVQQAGFLVLWYTTMPSILIEVGFLSNPAEEALLAKEEVRNDIAERITNAFSSYKMHYEKQNTSLISTANGKSQPSAATTDIIQQKTPPDVQEITISANSDDIRTTTTSQKPAIIINKATTNKKPATTSEPAVYYAIQIFATSTQKNINSKEYKSLKDIRCIHDGKFFKYVVEQHRIYDEALLSCMKLRAKYSDAFVVRIKGDKIIPLNK